jgi:hypothetical protein
MFNDPGGLTHHVSPPRLSVQPLGHSDLNMTMIYTHVLKKGGMAFAIRLICFEAARFIQKKPSGHQNEPFTSDLVRQSHRTTRK